MCHIFYVLSSAGAHSGFLHALAIVNNAAVNIGWVCVSFRVTVLPGYMPRSGIAGSYGDSMFSVLGNLHTVSYSGRTNLGSHQRCWRFPSLHTLSSICYLEFLMMVTDQCECSVALVARSCLTL